MKRTPLLALALIPPGALVLAGAIGARASPAHQAAPRRDAGTNRSSPALAARASGVGHPRPLALAAGVRRDEQFLSYLLKQEDRAIAAQQRSLRDLRRWESRLRDLDRLLERPPRSPARLQNLAEAARRGIGVLVPAIQSREFQILDGFVQENRLLRQVEQLAPGAAGLRVLLGRMAEQFRAIEDVIRLQTRADVAPLPRATTSTPTFPPGKPAASPVQA